MVRQNSFCNEKLNKLFEDAETKLYTYNHDEKYAQRVEKHMKTIRGYA